jgi:sulfocyanin
MSRKGTPKSRTAASAAPWLVAQNAATKSVTFKVIAAYTSTANGFNFNGAAHGAMTFTVPLDWKVTLLFQNRATVPHSAVIAASRTATTPVFPGAATPRPTIGLGQGQKATVTFTASKAGRYYLVCAVPGHEGLGMWDTFVVSPTAKSPSVSG